MPSLSCGQGLLLVYFCYRYLDYQLFHQTFAPRPETEGDLSLEPLKLKLALVQFRKDAVKFSQFQTPVFSVAVKSALPVFSWLASRRLTTRNDEICRDWNKMEPVIIKLFNPEHWPTTVAQRNGILPVPEPGTLVGRTKLARQRPLGQTMTHHSPRVALRMKT